MTYLLEQKEKLKGFYGKYDVYLQPLIKFILSFLVFFVIDGNLGFMNRISSFPVTLVLALLGAILPLNATIVIAGVVILLHLYALSLEVAVTAFMLFILIYLLYFRFAPKDSFTVLLTPICFHLHIGSVMPLTAGLLGKAYSVISLICGTVVYFFLNGVKSNAALLSDTGSDDNTASKFVMTWNQIFGNKEMYLVLGATVAVTLVVIMVRSLSIDHAWSVAIIIGAILNFIIQFAGILLLGLSGKVLWLVVGTVASVVIGFILEFLFFNLDYTRTERVQFEDDEYYYYVKAIPKMIVTSSEKQVKKFGTGRDELEEKLIRRQLSDEMDIDEELFR